MLVLTWLVISALYLFSLIVLLHRDFNCSKSLLSSSVEKVTTGAYNFVSVIWNVKTHFSDQVKVKGISQLIKGMSRVF